MSKSFTTRPSVARTARGGTGARGRGRGRGTQTKTQNQPKMQGPGYTTGGPGAGAGARPRGGPGQFGQPNPAVNGEHETDGDTSGAGQQERIQRRDAYSVISPNEKKRAEISRQAKKEEEIFKQYKEEKKLGRVSYVGTAGGGEMTEAEARRKSQQKQRSSNFERRMKSQQYKDQEKQRENAENEKKKAEARRKAEQNKQTDAKRQTSLQDDHRRTNQAFLDRLERETKEKQREKLRTKHEKPAQPINHVEDEDVDQSDDDYDYEEGATANPAPATHSVPAATGGQLRELQIYFPTYDPKYLEDILLQMHGDVDRAKHLLS